MEGFKWMFTSETDLEKHKTGLVTVWSAPNYCYRCGNIAAILSLDEELNHDFKTFNAVPESSKSVHPK